MTVDSSIREVQKYAFDIFKPMNEGTANKGRNDEQMRTNNFTTKEGGEERIKERQMKERRMKERQLKERRLKEQRMKER